jgi:hypothetical protein
MHNSDLRKEISRDFFKIWTPESALTIPKGPNFWAREVALTDPPRIVSGTENDISEENIPCKTYFLFQRWDPALAAFVLLRKN